MLLRDILEEANAKRAFDLLRIGGETVTSHAQLQRAARMAQHLRTQCPEDGAVAVTAPSPWDAAVGLLAGLLAQRTISLINPLQPEDMRAAQLSLLGAPFIVSAERAGLWAQEGAADLPSAIALPEDRAAVVVFTSGSSGAPKAILHSYRSLSAIVERSFDLYPSGVDLISMPMHSLGGIQCLLLNLALRRCLCLPEGPDRPAFLSAALRHRPQTILCFPSYAASLLEAEDRAALREAVEVIHTGGEKLTLDLRCDLEAGLNCAVYPAYGMAEFGPIAVNRSSAPEAGESLGDVLPGLEMKLRPLLGSQADSDTGELLVTGPSKMMGYRHTDGGFEACGDWIETGDVLRRDPDGVLWHLGRKSDLICFGDQQVSLSEMERLLAASPVVKTAAAVATPRASVTVFIQPQIGMRQDQVRATIQLLLNVSWKGIVGSNDIILVDELPLNAAGKVDRAVLRETAALRPVAP